MLRAASPPAAAAVSLFSAADARYMPVLRPLLLVLLLSPAGFHFCRHVAHAPPRFSPRLCLRVLYFSYATRCRPLAAALRYSRLKMLLRHYALTLAIDDIDYAAVTICFAA